jgi:hypothetical protein
MMTVEGVRRKQWFWQQIPADVPPCFYCSVCRGPSRPHCEQEQHAYRQKGCAICRVPFPAPCTECQWGNSSYQGLAVAEKMLKSKEYQAIWQTLLLVRQRLCRWMPRALIARICNMAWYIAGPSLHRLHCPLILLDCHHIYHYQCMVRWTRKRDICPLDNITVSELRPDQILLQGVWRKAYIQIVRHT